MQIARILNVKQIVVSLFFLLFSIIGYSQYFFKKDQLPYKVSLENYTSIADVGQKKLDIQFVLKNFDSLKPVS